MELNKPPGLPDGEPGANDKVMPRAAVGRRMTVRTGLRCAAMVMLPGDQRREVHTCDMSRDGLSVMSAKPISPGTRCTVRFDVPLGHRSPTVTVAAKSIYSSYTGPDGFKVGLMFGALDADAESVIDAFMRLENL